MADDSTIHVVEDPRYQDHRSPGGHPERPERLVAVSRALAAFEGQLQRLAVRQADPEELMRVHARDHLAHIEAAVAHAPAHLDPDTFVSPESLEVARLAAGGAVDLARAVARGDARCGFAAVRPPGHHAESDRAMGFCLFNNVAIAARALQREEGLARILIFDWDVHHGNGTQHSFEEDPSILYVSTHQFPHYPGTGSFQESGAGDGDGATVNIPLPAGAGDADYIGAVQRLVVPVARQFRPEMILVSCGFDAHADDPLASMQLTGAGYLAMTRILRALANELCAGRITYILEGGYAPSGLIEGTTAVLQGMLEVSSPQLASAPDAPPGSLLRSVVDGVVAVHGHRYPGLGSG